jgi:hypothetical protein
VKRALDNGVTREELIELVTQLAFYGGWPVANSAVPILRKAFEEAGASSAAHGDVRMKAIAMPARSTEAPLAPIALAAS